MTTTALRRTIFIIAILVIWEAAYRLIGWESWKFPSLFQTVESFYTGFAHGQLLDAIYNSLRRLFIAFAISLSVGMVLGLMFAKFKAIDDTIGFLVIALQTVPSIAWLPFAIIWFGFNDVSVIFITALGATWTMSIATRTGIKNIPPIYLRAAQTLGTGNGWRMFTQILVPGAFPHLMTGVRVSWAFAWRALVAGELIANGAGLGQLLQDGRGLGDTALMLNVVIIIAVLGTLSDHFCFKKLEDRLLVRYGLESNSKS